MKLLIVTQKVNIDDDILGFFHGWVTEFAKHCEQVTVVCLEKGRHTLPKNVKVLSLGKENKKSKITYISLFYKYIWQERNNYDSVFVHMNPVYIVLGGPLWVAWRKKIGLWYIHPKVGSFLKTAHLFVDVIFTANKGTFPFFSQKICEVGHGIDTELFKPEQDIEKEKNSILYVGRITPIKRLEIVVDAIRILKKQGVDVTLHLIGGPDARYMNYYEKFKNDTSDLETEGIIFYHGQISNTSMPKWYTKYEILVNVTPSGSFDKVVLEAMASGMLIATSNKNFSSLVPSLCFVKDDTSISLADSINSLLSLSEEKKRKYEEILRDTIVQKNNIKVLIKKVVEKLK